MPLTEEEEKALTSKITDTVLKGVEKVVNDTAHKAFSQRADRLETKITEHVDGKLGEVTKAIEGFSAKLESTGKPKPGDKPGDKPDKPTGELSDDAKAQIAESRKLAEDAKAKADKWEKTAREKEAEALRAEEITALQGKLTGSVRPEVLDVFVAQLHGKHVVRDKANPKVMLWKKDDGEMLPLDAGVKEWSESDAGKSVRPPVDANGSGGRGPSGVTLPTGGQVTLETLGSILTRQR